MHARQKKASFGDALERARCLPPTSVICCRDDIKSIVGDLGESAVLFQAYHHERGAGHWASYLRNGVFMNKELSVASIVRMYRYGSCKDLINSCFIYSFIRLSLQVIGKWKFTFTSIVTQLVKKATETIVVMKAYAK